MILRRTVIGMSWAIVGAGAAAQHGQMPSGMSHEQHLRQMQKDADLKDRGARAMGFDQDKATHRFRLTGTGGAIEVSVNDPADTTSAARIRAHLNEIAVEFGNGVFDKPFATHAEVPPGVSSMKRLKALITYTYEETADGGLVRIQTADAEARRAVHDFLCYQTKEHGTGGCS